MTCYDIWMLRSAVMDLSHGVARLPVDPHLWKNHRKLIASSLLVGEFLR